MLIYQDFLCNQWLIIYPYIKIDLEDANIIESINLLVRKRKNKKILKFIKNIESH